MGLLSWLFDSRGDNRARADREQEVGRKLSPAMPMAGAGAELTSLGDKSETEDALKRVAKNDRSQ